MDYTSIRQSLFEGKNTCENQVKACIQRIKQNEGLNAFVEVYTEEALNKAKEVDLKIKNGTAGRLAGMVVGIKDVFCYTNHKVQAASKILEGYVSPFSATAVERLLGEDAIIIGRQNCDQFAMGSSNENSVYGPVLNPIDRSKVPGGSSGGSAASVAADLCHVSIGSDTGGSVRQPAAFCGIYGLKPTYGRISRHGMIAYSSSFDCVSILSRSIEDNALVLEVIAGNDDYDSTASTVAVDNYLNISPQSKPVRIAYLRETLESKGLQNEIKVETENKIRTLQEKGHIVESVDFPFLEYLLPSIIS